MLVTCFCTWPSRRNPDICRKLLQSSTQCAPGNRLLFGQVLQMPTSAYLCQHSVSFCGHHCKYMVLNQEYDFKMKEIPNPVFLYEVLELTTVPSQQCWPYKMWLISGHLLTVIWITLAQFKSGSVSFHSLGMPCFNSPNQTTVFYPGRQCKEQYIHPGNLCIQISKLKKKKTHRWGRNSNNTQTSQDIWSRSS